jgi:glycosyltransferase involved in cell wall biosynthesis
VESPVVAVWRDVWLVHSETFIRDQVGALTRWQPLLVGINQWADGLDVAPDYAPFSARVPYQLAPVLVRAPGVAGRYARVLRGRRASLLHAHFGNGAVAALPIARAAGVPLVATFHGYDLTRLPGLPYGAGRLYRRGLRDVFSRAVRLIAVSDFVADELRRLGAPPAKIAVHHIGTRIRPEPAVGSQRRGVAFVGRLVEKKGPRDLLRAVAQVPVELRQGPVRLVGVGPLETELRALAEQLGVAAEFLGRLSSDQVAGVLSDAAVFCTPSRTGSDGDAEGLGMVFLEAAMAAMPVVSYRHGGVPEAVVDGVTGLLADEGDVGGLAAALTRVLADPELAAELGRQGRLRALAEFDVVRQTVLLEELYDEAVGTIRR